MKTRYQIIERELCGTHFALQSLTAGNIVATRTNREALIRYVIAMGLAAITDGLTREEQREASI